jgi:hypothetical protein
MDNQLLEGGRQAAARLRPNPAGLVGSARDHVSIIVGSKEIRQEDNREGEVFLLLNVRLPRRNYCLDLLFSDRQLHSETGYTEYATQRQRRPEWRRVDGESLRSLSSECSRNVQEVRCTNRLEKY